jgi:hypothetical protein
MGVEPTHRRSGGDATVLKFDQSNPGLSATIQVLNKIKAARP